ITNVGKQMYIVAKQRVVTALETEKENMMLKQRISELDDKAVTREKNRADNAERKVQELSRLLSQNEQKANQAEAKVYNMEAFIRQSGFAKAFEHWTLLNQLIDDAIRAFNKWTHGTASIFSRDDERVIGRGIIAKCQMDGLDPSKESDRLAAMGEELAKCGIAFEFGDNCVTVKGNPKAPSAPLFSHNDHRVAMSLAVLLTTVGGTLDGAECVSKSFPDFWHELAKAGIDIRG
ncbi:MAG: hypothetical protein J5894_02790, partial [Clostridia bacterium]|nr:hypothetical protein [Clostridia bacterium]